MKKSLVILLVTFAILNSHAQTPTTSANLPLSTQLTISKASVYNQNNEVLNVFLIANSNNQSKGTGFLIKSGHVITNEHVIHGARLDQITLVSPNGHLMTVNNVVKDTLRDLAILTLTKPMAGGFELADDNAVLIGEQVYSWGYPLEYNGPAPLLSVGYVAGISAYQPYVNKFVKHFVVNGALNPGNSGGPLINSGKVVGVVQSKASPITPYILSALQALNNNSSGFMYNGTDANGKPFQKSEGQVIGEILTYYREISQVMIGEAVTVSVLKDFLNEQKIKGY